MARLGRREEGELRCVYEGSYDSSVISCILCRARLPPNESTFRQQRGQNDSVRRLKGNCGNTISKGYPVTVSAIYTVPGIPLANCHGLSAGQSRFAPSLLIER